MIKYQLVSLLPFCTPIKGLTKRESLQLKPQSKSWMAFFEFDWFAAILLVWIFIGDGCERGALVLRWARSVWEEALILRVDVRITDPNEVLNIVIIMSVVSVDCELLFLKRWL